MQTHAAHAQTVTQALDRTWRCEVVMLPACTAVPSCPSSRLKSYQKIHFIFTAFMLHI